VRERPAAGDSSICVEIRMLMQGTQFVGQTASGAETQSQRFLLTYRIASLIASLMIGTPVRRRDTGSVSPGLCMRIMYNSIEHSSGEEQAYGQ